MKKPFFFSGGTYKYKYQKTTQKLTKALEWFLRILLQLCCSRFQNRILDANPKAWELERNYLERNQT